MSRLTQFVVGLGLIALGAWVAWIAFTAFPQYTIPVLAVSAVALFIGGYLAAGVVRPRD